MEGLKFLIAASEVCLNLFFLDEKEEVVIIEEANAEPDNSAPQNADFTELSLGEVLELAMAKQNL